MKTTLKLLSLFFIITLFGCEENNYYTTPDGLGKVNVYIEGDLTDAECAAKLKVEVGSLTENIYIGGTRPLTNLTTLELDIPLNVRNINFYNGYGCEKIKTVKITGHGAMPQCSIKYSTGLKTENVLIEGFTELFELTIFSFPEQEQPATLICNDLITVHWGFTAGGGVSNQVGGGFVANKLICNDLKYVDPNGVYQGSGAGFAGVFDVFSVNGLKKIGGGLYLSLGGGAVSNYTFPALEETGDLIISNVSSSWTQTLNSINLPLLNRTFGMSVTNNYLNALNLPALTKCDYMTLRDQVLPSTTINMPALNYCQTYISDLQLTTNGVNAILNKFLTIPNPSVKGIDLLQEVAPTGQGLLDKQTLIAQGNYVYTN